MSVQHEPFTYDHYRYMLQSALDNGYEFISYPRVKEALQDEQRQCLLRHDCDNDLVAAATMARIEQQFGIRSTYFLMLRSAMYNLMAIPNADLVRDIAGRGHWFGLHFDEMFCADATPEEIRLHVDKERGWLSEQFQLPIDVVSFHQPKRRVLDNVIRINCLNTYDRNDMEGVYYLSDSCMNWKEGCPSAFFQARKHPRLQLLIHPEWWTSEPMSVLEKWNQMLRNNFSLMQGSLLSREKVYKTHQEIRFGVLTSAMRVDYQPLTRERAERDGSAILGLGSTLAWENWTLDNLLAERPDKWSLSYIASIDRAPVAYAVASRLNGRVHLHHLIVGPDRRGLGVGGELLRTVASRAREMGIQQMTLKVHKHNLRAVDFYRKNGFDVLPDSDPDHFWMSAAINEIVAATR